MAKVIREGHTGVASIKAKELVPGDIVEVSSMFLLSQLCPMMQCNFLFSMLSVSSTQRADT